MLFEDATPEPDSFYHSILLLVMLDSKNSDNNRFPMKLSKAINFLSGTVAHLVFFFFFCSFFVIPFCRGFSPFVWFQFHFPRSTISFHFFLDFYSNYFWVSSACTCCYLSSLGSFLEVLPLVFCFFGRAHTGSPEVI